MSDFIPIPDAVIERARAVRIEDLLGKLGKELPGKKTKRNGPCPACGGTDRFSIDTKKRVWFCRHCAKGGGIVDLVKNIYGCGFREAVETLTGERIEQQDTKRAQPRQRDIDRENADYEKRQAEKAQYIWLQRWPIAGSPAETYLREARRYAGPLPATLGYLEPTKPEHHPAMVAAFAVCDEPEPGVVGEPRGVTSVHLTLLKPDSSGKADVKPNKIIIGRPLGRPIVLAPPNDLLGLAITEGIEDALSVHAATSLGAWSAGAASFLPTLADIVPDYIEVVHVLVDDDPAGVNYANKLVHRLRARGIEVIPKLLRSKVAAA